MNTISKTTQSLTTAGEMRDQTKLMMQPYANWEEYLAPAPLSIAILGELVFISAKADFSINDKPPIGGYKFIKHPDSFRSCLMQVCNSGWWAFNEAHKNMDLIRFHTARVPDYMKTAVKILFQGDDEVVKVHLPKQLENIIVVADECVVLSEATVNRFAEVINTTGELLRVCMSAQNSYEEELEETKKKLEEAELREKSAQEAKKRTAKIMSDMEKEMKEARGQYQNAMDSIPSAWEMIGMDLVGGIAQGIIGKFDRMTNAIISHLEGNPHSGDLVDAIGAYSKSDEILKYAQDIQELMKVKCENDEVAWTNLFDQKNKFTKSDIMKLQFQRIKDDLDKNPDCPAKDQAQDICKNGIEICNTLAKYAPAGKCDKDKSKEIIVRVLDLVKSALKFDCKSKNLTNSSAISPKPPNMQNVESKSMNMSFSQRAADDARLKVELNRAQMNKARETYEKCVEKLEKNQEELNEVLVTMRNCKLEEKDFNTTIEMLVKGMDAMGRVKEQWEKMVRFFQMISNIVKTSLSTTLKDFALTSEKTQHLSYNAKLFSKDLLYKQASQAGNIASLVHTISGTYTEISSKYLMDRVISLSKLMAMDKSKPEFKHAQEQLRNVCDTAQKAILNCVLENKKELERKSKARIEKIDRELLAILPAAPPEKTKMIEEAIKAGFSEEEEASYY
ncbi:uncharacterized protein [Pseudorasbora parva]|uniref:uncharacterized protein n=1 Tax=Pseudorasbora parva TaxID=51549 RepID=UPI00351EE8C2